MRYINYKLKHHSVLSWEIPFGKKIDVQFTYICGVQTSYEYNKAEKTSTVVITESVIWVGLWNSSKYFQMYFYLIFKYKSVTDQNWIKYFYARLAYFSTWDILLNVFYNILVLIVCFLPFSMSNRHKLISNWEIYPII